MKAARQQQIVELLNQHHTLTTEALSHLLQVSIETIRRDLSELQKQGRLQRSHGQARVLQRNNHNGEKQIHLLLSTQNVSYIKRLLYLYPLL